MIRLRGSFIGAALILAILVTGCSDNRPRVTLESSSEQRAPATERVVLGTSLGNPGQVAFIDSQLRDQCLVDPGWFQRDGDSRPYYCFVDRVSLYSITEKDATAAAQAAISALLASGCQPDGAFASDQAVDSPVVSVPFTCEGGSGLATLGLPGDHDIRALIDRGASAGSGLIHEDPIELRRLDELASDARQFALVLTSTNRYYEAEICDDLRRC